LTADFSICRRAEVQVSYSDKDDFEKDPFDQESSESDSFSENGTSEDSGKSGDEPSPGEPDFDLDFPNAEGGIPADDTLIDADSSKGTPSFDDMLGSLDPDFLEPLDTPTGDAEEPSEALPLDAGFGTEDAVPVSDNAGVDPDFDSDLTGDFGGGPVEVGPSEEITARGGSVGEDVAAPFTGGITEGEEGSALGPDFLNSLGVTPGDGEELSVEPDFDAEFDGEGAAFASDGANFDAEFDDFGGETPISDDEASTETFGEGVDDLPEPDEDFLNDLDGSATQTPRTDGEKTDPFAVLNAKNGQEGESTPARLAELEDLMTAGTESADEDTAERLARLSDESGRDEFPDSSDGENDGEDTLARLGLLSGGSAPKEDDSVAAALAGLSGMIDGDETGNGAVPLAQTTEERDESLDEQPLENMFGEEETGSAELSDALDQSGGEPETGDIGFDRLGDSEFGAAGLGFGETGDFSEADESEEVEVLAPKKGKKAKAKKGKKDSEEGPKKKRSRRRSKKRESDPVSRLLNIPMVFFVLYLVLGNIKGFVEWLVAGKEGHAFDSFCLPFFLIAFNAVGLVLLLLPALLRAFRRRYAEDPKLTEYTLFRVMLALAVAGLIFACHPIIFDLARHWGKPM
jgi:hypothetical protein